MKLNNLPLILSLVCAVSVSANAATTATTTTAPKHKGHHHKAHHEEAKHEERMMKKDSMNQDYNFVTLKAGLVNPTPLGGNTGLNVGNDTYTAGLSVGRKFEDRYALEFEYMYRGKNSAHAYNANYDPSLDNTDWKASSNTYMLNAMADLIECEKFRPYLKAGIGMSSNKAYSYVFTQTNNNNDGTSTTSSYTYSGKTTNSFAWQVGAGMNMKTTEMFDTQLQYMYVDRGALKTHANYTGPATTVNSSARKGWMKEHVITLGLTTKF